MSHHDDSTAERGPQEIADLPKDKVARFDAALPEILKRYPADHKEAAMLAALRRAQEILRLALARRPRSWSPIGWGPRSPARRRSPPST